MSQQEDIVEMPQQIRDILDANIVDLTNRLDACAKTPLINPEKIPFTISRISTKADQEIFVVRDDFLCGGGKSRYGYEFIRSKVLEGYREFVYISPWYGAACIALGWLLKVISQETGYQLKATIFIDEYPLYKIGELPPFIKIGLMYGVNVIQVPLDQEKFRIAEEYTTRSGALFINPGFDHHEVIDEIANTVRIIREQYGIFDEVWSAVGSGTLIRGLQKGNLGNKYFGVCIFGHCPDIGIAIPVIHYQGPNIPVKPEDAAPFRSAQYYDSKVWQYVRDRPGKILLWNVA